MKKKLLFISALVVGCFVGSQAQDRNGKTNEPQSTKVLAGERINDNSKSPAYNNTKANPSVIETDKSHDAHVATPMQTTVTKTEVKTNTVTHAPRTVYAEGKQKGQPIRTASTTHPAANPAGQEQEKAMLEKRKQTNPVRVTNTTAEQKATYKERRQAELNSARKKQ